MSAASRELTEFAPAKVNLTLQVFGRRADGYHEIDSLVVFADIGDRLTLVPDQALELVVRGPTAPAAGASPPPPGGPQDLDDFPLRTVGMISREPNW